jgi:dolichyl-diphosphooligosaccharide--protein glycosyltransferase
MTTFVAFLWLWSRAVRTPGSWPWSVLAGVMYVCAACTWGGYIFLNNIVAVHAAVIVALGKHNYGLYRSYTILWVIGSLGASCVPVIGWAPIRSLEQMPALLTFCVFQVMQVCDLSRAAQKGGMSAWRFFFFRCGVFLALAGVAAGVAYALWDLGFFMPLGARIRGLFLKAQKTGNPLVDSVAEHQLAALRHTPNSQSVE